MTAAKRDLKSTGFLGRTWRKLKEAWDVSPQGLVRKRRSLAPLQELEDRCMLSVTAVGAEFRVNTYTRGPQQTFPDTPQAVAVNPMTGDFVVVWSSQGQNAGGGWDVYLQRYNAQGVPQGGETLVDTPANGVNQQFANVAMAPNGNFVVTWSSNQGGHWNVYAQMYSAAGTPQGAAIQVDTPTNQDQEYSTVAMDGSGNFVITWSGKQSGNWNTYASEFNATGTPQTGVFGVSTQISGQDQMFSDVAMNAAGNFVITWLGHQSGHWVVYAQDYAPSGIPSGANFQVSATTTADQAYSTAAMDANGDFTITWSGRQSGHSLIYAQSYQANGIPVGSNFQVSPTTNDDQEYATIAMQPNGDYLITWSSHNQDGNGWGIYAQAFSNSGTPQGSEFLVNTYTQNDQEWSAVAMDNSGRAVIVWSSNGEDGDNWGVYAQQYLTSNIIVTPTAGLRTTSAGGTASFQVVLAQAPLGIVTIPWASSNINEGTVSTPSTTFTLLDWNIPQTVTITGINDGISTGNVNYLIFGGPATTLIPDPNFRGELAPTVFVTNTYGTVSPGITVSPTNVTTSESGATANFTVVLNTAPAASTTVTINLTNGNPAAGSLSQTTLNFDATNWNVAQTVTVTGLNNYITTPNQTYQITGRAMSTDGNYNGMAMTPVTVTNIATGITITGNSILVAEDNSVLRINPLTGTVIASYPTVLANDGAVIGPDGSLYVGDYADNAILHFDAAGTLQSSFATIATPQGLTFGPDGNLYVTTTSSTVEEYSPAGVFIGTFITAGSGGLNNAKAIVWGPDGNAYVSSYFNSKVIRYNGMTGAFMNVFATGSGGFEDLTFGPDNNLYVASYGDNAVYRYDGTTGASLGTFVSGVATPFGLRFDPAGNLDVSSRSTGQVLTYNGTTGAFIGTLETGLTNPAYITNTTSLVTSEAGTSATFSITLESQPTAPVTINLTNGNPAAGSLTQTSLTFDATNWNVAQTVTVTGLNDNIMTPGQTYQITGIATSTDPNYNGMAITPVTVTNMEFNSPNSASSVYGQATTIAVTIIALAPATGTPTGTVTFIDGTTNLATVSLSGGSASFTTSALVVGSHVISIHYSGDSHFAPLTQVFFTHTVTPATLTVTANDASSVYGHADPTFTDTIAGFVNGENSSVVSGSASLTTTATSSSSVGTYAITAGPGSLSAANYTFQFVNGTLTVGQAPLTITANDKSMTYGGSIPTLDATFTGLVNGDTNVVVSGLSLSTTATSSSNIGPYTIGAMGGTAANYAITDIDGTLTVTPATLTVTANDVSKVYGQANPVFTGTISGYVNGDTPSVVSGAPSLTTPATAASGVGAYGITAALGSLNAANYNFAFANGTLTVTLATLTVTANDASKVYGQANPVFTGTISGYVNGDAPSVVSGTPSLTTPATTASGVGAYDITADLGSLHAANYNFAFANGTLTVTPATLTVTANDASKVYGQANPVFTDTISGYVNGDTSSVVSGSPSLAIPATAASGVGAYDITAALGSLNAANYNFAFANGTLTVTPATLTVTANDASKVYGQANPVFTDTIAGFVTGDASGLVSGTVSLTTTATASSSVGTYTIKAGEATISAANYNFAFVNGRLTITPVVLTVIANDASKVYGQDNPALTDSITGFVNGDTASVVNGSSSLSTTATVASGVGTYPITAQGSLSAANYLITFVNGTLTVVTGPTASVADPLTASRVSFQISAADGQGVTAATSSPSAAPTNVPSRSAGSLILTARSASPVVSRDDLASSQSLDQARTWILAAGGSVRLWSARDQAAWQNPEVNALLGADDLTVRRSPVELTSSNTEFSGADGRLQISIPWQGPENKGQQDLGFDALADVGVVAMTGLLASAGYVLLNTRAGFWVLSLLTARPLWNDLDPLEIVYAWEKADGPKQGGQRPKDETLLSLVE